MPEFVIVPFLFLVCYNEISAYNFCRVVIVPFLFLVCYNCHAYEDDADVGHSSLFILGML